METLQYLISHTLRYAIVFFVAAFAWWLIALVFPNLSLQSLITAVGGKTATSTTTQTKEDWLPAPGSFGSIFGRKAVAPTATTNLYVPGPAYSGNAYNDNKGGSEVTYTTYTTSDKTGGTFNYAPYVYTTSTPSTTTQPPQATTTSEDIRRLYVRNLSIFEGGSIYTNISFTGEARNTMFKDGTFPIILIDNTGKGGVIAIAQATTNWTIPGWTRFQTKITANLPIRVPCTLLFQSANGTPTQKPIQIVFPVRCN